MKFGIELNQHTPLTNIVSGRSFGEVYTESPWED